MTTPLVRFVFVVFVVLPIFLVFFFRVVLVTVFVLVLLSDRKHSNVTSATR
jgi:hypothetical protein